ncbi:MAG: hypothetical protein KJZ86_18750 [Caldilineaceae bacterium]|nr:hypothetical protein [Caldilineaceae bacterium]
MSSSSQSAYQLTDAPGPRQRRSRAKGCFVTIFWLVVILAVLAGAGYWAVQSGRISLIQVSALLTGTGEILVVNTGDGVLRVEYTRIDTEDGVPDEIDSQRIESFDIGGRGGLELGRYRLDFSAEGDQPPPLSCSLRVSRNDKYSFVVVPQGIAVALEGYPTQNGAEVNAATSPLCQQ